MASRNDVTGDSLVSKTSNADYRKNYERIFGKKKATEETSEKPKDDTDKKE